MLSLFERDDIHTLCGTNVNESAGLREIRSSCQNVYTSSRSNEGFVLFASPAATCLFVLIVVLLALLALGLVKALLGMFCCPPVGMCGLGALIDLPRPLNHYQEEELADFPVQYDLIGWPVHPQTKKRSVRAISIRCEFCLNVIFFVTYPLVLALTIMTTICFMQVYDNEEADDKVYRKDHTIMLTECPSIMCKAKHQQQQQQEQCAHASSDGGQNVYSDDAATEEVADTRYVFEQLQSSEEQLRRNRY